MDGRILIIFGMAVATYFPRLLPMLALTRWNAPSFLVRWLGHIPAAIFSALIFPAILLRGGNLSIDFSNLQLGGTLCCLLVVWKTRNLALTVISGVLAVFFLGFIF